ncbi:MAG TPA: SPOR domain-containing protein [Bacteroidales bacterium]|nr:SPOR domain-containing protein [Bacteroidales bacterium]HOH84463.1 SPOR domain-containing protein [Bacteroidales bacterium]
MRIRFIRIVFLGVFLLASRAVFSQDNVLRQKISVIEDPQIVSLVQKHIYLNEKQKITGWRVQIFFESGNNSKSRAHAKKGLFMTLFPGTGVYLMFQSPYYKVRVGDFRSRMDAEGFKQKIINDFPDSFVVKDEINFPEL